MGYRSDVKIVLVAPEKTCKADVIAAGIAYIQNELKKTARLSQPEAMLDLLDPDIMSETKASMPLFGTSDGVTAVPVTLFSWFFDSYKWYSDSEQALDELLEAWSAPGIYLAYRFVRLGEDFDDIEQHTNECGDNAARYLNSHIAGSYPDKDLSGFLEDYAGQLIQVQVSSEFDMKTEYMVVGGKVNLADPVAELLNAQPDTKRRIVSPNKGITGTVDGETFCVLYYDQTLLSNDFTAVALMDPEKPMFSVIYGGVTRAVSADLFVEMHKLPNLKLSDNLVEFISGVVCKVSV